MPEFLGGAIQVVDFSCFKETSGGRFGSKVALRGGEKFVTYHELTNRGGTEERREIVRVKMPRFVRLAVGWPLVEAHRIGESRFEQIVVPDSDATQDVAEEIAFFCA